VEADTARRSRRHSFPVALLRNTIRKCLRLQRGTRGALAAGWNRFSFATAIEADPVCGKADLVIDLPDEHDRLSSDLAVEPTIFELFPDDALNRRNQRSEQTAIVRCPMAVQ
jgi:hypothetical protein